MFTLLSKTYFAYTYFISYIINGEYQRAEFSSAVARDKFITDTRNALKER